MSEQQESSKKFFTVRCSCQHCGAKMFYKRYIDDWSKHKCDECGKEEKSKLDECGLVNSNIAFVYNRDGALKTTESFNDRLKDIKKNVPYMVKDNINVR